MDQNTRYSAYYQRISNILIKEIASLPYLSNFLLVSVLVGFLEGSAIAGGTSCVAGRFNK
jgi:hypothetical protein